MAVHTRHWSCAFKASSTSATLPRSHHVSALACTKYRGQRDLRRILPDGPVHTSDRSGVQQLAEAPVDTCTHTVTPHSKYQNRAPTMRFSPTYTD